MIYSSNYVVVLDLWTHFCFFHFFVIFSTEHLHIRSHHAMLCSFLLFFSSINNQHSLFLMQFPVFCTIINGLTSVTALSNGSFIYLYVCLSLLIVTGPAMMVYFCISSFLTIMCARRHCIMHAFRDIKSL